MDSLSEEKEEGGSGWKPWRQRLSARPSLGPAVLPPEPAAMWAQSVRRGRSVFYFHPRSHFLLTEKLGIRAVFFMTSKSPDRRMRDFLKGEGPPVLPSSAGPGGRGRSGGSSGLARSLWPARPSPGRASHPGTRWRRHSLWVWGSHTLSCVFTWPHMAEGSGFYKRALGGNAFGGSTRGLHPGPAPTWGRRLCLCPGPSAWVLGQLL